MIKSLEDARMTDSIPKVLAGQDWVAALSGAMGFVHRRTMEYVRASQVYTGLDAAPEAVLDALAVCWKVDWYNTDYPLEVKRRIIQKAMDVRRMMGTAYAVRAQADAVLPGSRVEEWFEYGGQPGRFRLHLDLTDAGMTLPVLRQLVRELNQIKNIRSHLDEGIMEARQQAQIYVGATAAVSQEIDLFAETERE